MRVSSAQKTQTFHQNGSRLSGSLGRLEVWVARCRSVISLPFLVGALTEAGRYIAIGESDRMTLQEIGKTAEGRPHLMAIVRIGAVSYLNARPLVEGLETMTDRFAVRYDLPSTCAQLLHEREIDLGLIPSIEYLRGEGYRIVPDCAVAADGPVASVAIFTSMPIERVRSIALDTSSRTSVTLIRVLCHYRFRISPRFVSHGPDVAAMTREHDAGLLIGDPAFDADHESMGLAKVDLGEEWTTMTGLPFIYAAWTGRPGVVTDADVRALQDAQAEGVANLDQVPETGALIAIGYPKLKGGTGGYARYVAICPPDWKFGTSIGPADAPLPKSPRLLHWDDKAGTRVR